MTTSTSTTPTSTTFSITPVGAFSLREAAEFGFGQRHATRFAGTMRMAFCVDGYAAHAGVALTQDADGVHGIVSVPPGAPPPDVERVAAQTSRILSLDVDARPYEAVAAADPVLAPVIAAAPGLRPPLFHSPYEAAAWCVLSLRWSGRQAAGVRGRLEQAHGAVIEVAGEEMSAFPTPEQLLSVAEFPGIPAVKMERMHAVARAALDGRLDAAELRALDPETVRARLRELPGIGPFGASLVLLRTVGVTDVPVDQEPRLAEIVGRLYGLPGPASSAEMLRIAEGWRPFRTWIGVLLRAAAARVAPAA
jgi:DNA-3-methyladenine glycosylase II